VPGNEVCPLTAEEVSTAIGATVTEQGSCQFAPTGRSVFNNVSFAYQSASACTEENLRKAGYTEPGTQPGVGADGAVEGFGVDAYAHNLSLGLIVIVCDGDRPFELVLDGVDGDDVSVAMVLATLARNG